MTSMVLAVAKCGREAKQQGLPARPPILGLLLLDLLRHLLDTGHHTRAIHKAEGHGQRMIDRTN